MKRAVLVNGVPASGKSTVMTGLVAQMDAAGIATVPLALDTLKEGLFAHIGSGDRAHNRMLGRASYHAIFNSIAAFPDSLVTLIDAWHGFEPAEVLRAHIARAGIQRLVEVWVSVEPTVAATRYRGRSGQRHAGHLPASYADELFKLAEVARPQMFGPVIDVDGAAPLPRDLGAQVMAALAAEESNV
jgi:glucokinase